MKLMHPPEASWEIKLLQNDAGQLRNWRRRFELWKYIKSIFQRMFKIRAIKPTFSHNEDTQKWGFVVKPKRLKNAHTSCWTVKFCKLQRQPRMLVLTSLNLPILESNQTKYQTASWIPTQNCTQCRREWGTCAP